MSGLFPATPGMVNDLPQSGGQSAPAPGPGSVLSTAGTPPPAPGGPRMNADLASKIYPDSRLPFRTTDPTAPVSPGERYQGSGLYPKTEGMVDDTGEPGADGMPAADDPRVAAYEVPLPEDFQADEAQVGELRQLAVKHGLRPQAAGELVGLHAKVLQAQQAKLDADIAGWAERSRSLPEWTDPQRPAALEAVRSVLPPSARTWLDHTAFGSHPEVVRMVLSLGREIVRLKGGGGPFNNTPGMRP